MLWKASLKIRGVFGGEFGEKKQVPQPQRTRLWDDMFMGGDKAKKKANAEFAEVR